MAHANSMPRPRSLPASWLKDKNLAVAKGKDPITIDDLDVSRLNKIHHRLHLVGQLVPARPLHHQLLLRREIVITQKMDMHLLWEKGRIFLKPLPNYLLDNDWWKTCLRCEQNCHKKPSIDFDVNEHQFCEREQRYRALQGFLLSYAALVRDRIDFNIAKKSEIIPRRIKWNEWKTVVEAILETPDIYQHVNKRFWYGELRLHRLNLIYRFLGYDIVRGYHYTYDGYSDFLRDQFTWLAATTVYIAIVLTAMQAGLATDRLHGNNAFQAVSVGFTAFSIIAPLLGVGVVMGSFIVLLIGNWTWTSKSAKNRLNQMGLGVGTKEVSTNPSAQVQLDNSIC
ncbi:hypothetical protein K461DRAFT_263872 [Myriangium duriaei CBS 260.36]|uniref:Uncharacterized protein n=1 Tax=Myriangium duriaei CBS 260.36 TaxID=1168546 RepID=A0A9P4MJ94_9PEZI|nr:hypothetical protein K461DRAFT_263872 [Myriangium duriaei CBS 260.36]